jgi:hypothetical protein
MTGKFPRRSKPKPIAKGGTKSAALCIERTNPYQTLPRHTAKKQGCFLLEKQSNTPKLNIQRKKTTNPGRSYENTYDFGNHYSDDYCCPVSDSRKEETARSPLPGMAN